jgi:nitrite reductase/ring-hydroxylating ferredoxin subunit
MTHWTAICRVDDIPLLGSRRVARGQGLPVALFRTAGDRVHALLDRCPHKGGPLSQGIVFGEAWPARCTTGRLPSPTAGRARPTKAARRPSPARSRAVRSSSMPTSWPARRWT